jgi:hypothetical protein
MKVVKGMKDMKEGERRWAAKPPAAFGRCGWCLATLARPS